MNGRPGIQPEEVFGCALAELDYETLRQLVEGHVGSEPLVWEAKGAEMVEKRRTQGLRKAVSAFANSVDGGFVLIGVENAGTERHVALQATGARFPDDEPGRWISNALGTFQLRPRPWFDVRQIAVPGEEGRQIAVVWVPPIDSPPCIADGSVYERVVGVSAPVQDPARLAALYRRGEVRREAAEQIAEREYAQMHNDATDTQIGRPGAYACVCIALLQPAPSLRERLFARETYDAVEERLKAVGAGGSMLAPEVTVTHAQHALNGHLTRPSGRSLAARVRIGSAGYVAVAAKGLGSTQPEALLWTWQLACELYGAAADSRNDFEHYLMALTADGSEVARIARGPVTFPTPDGPDRADVEREIERASGRFAWTPNATELLLA
jgi:hypothetical protein